MPQRTNILADQIIQLTGANVERRRLHLLRRIVVWDELQPRELVLLTNHLEFGPTTIAAIYKERWQIELFFKTLKQNLKSKTFVGTTTNALRIQIWTALLALLMIKLLQFRARRHWSLANLVTLPHWNLFTYRDLWAWLNNPFETPPLTPLPVQLAFPLPGLGQHARLKLDHLDGERTKPVSKGQ